MEMQQRMLQLQQGLEEEAEALHSLEPEWQVGSVDWDAVRMTALSAAQTAPPSKAVATGKRGASLRSANTSCQVGARSRYTHPTPHPCAACDQTLGLEPLCIPAGLWATHRTACAACVVCAHEHSRQAVMLTGGQLPRVGCRR